MYTKIICYALLSLCASTVFAQNKIQIIPEPVDIQLKGGDVGFVWSNDVFFEYDSKDSLQEAAILLFQKYLDKTTGLQLKLSKDGEKGRKGVKLQIIEGLSLQKEGYRLSVTENSILITAPTNAGLLYGLQTLLQLIPIDGEPRIPLLEITDYPRLAWRGFMLDVSRHFFTKDYILSLLDVLAMHKINVFHWHLTDNHGWRIEIKKYPLLTDVAAWRADRTGLPWRERTSQKEGEKATYGGYYTQEDIKEVVRYAEKLNITVVPEIEMPGHTVEVFAAYPEYSCEGKILNVPVGGAAIGNAVFCAGKENVFHFLEEVIDEVVSLFPSEYVHIGGDEVSKTQWQACKHCQQRIVDEKLKDEEELQAYFIRRMSYYLASKGKKMIGWDEILQGGLPENATVMSWRGFEGGIEAIKLKHQVIMTPSLFTYLNFYQSSPDFEPANRSAFVTSLKTAYSFNPVPEELSVADEKYILGAQACVWAEFIPNEKHLEYMLFPRLGATADAMWTPNNKREWNAFLEKQETQRKRYKRLGFGFSKGSYLVDAQLSYKKDSKIEVSLSTEQINPVIRYTTDGSVPSKTSLRYTVPLTFSSKVEFKAGIFEEGKLMNNPLELLLIPGNKVFDKSVSYSIPYMKKYTGGGLSALVDGKYGDKFRVNEKWQGFDQNIDLIIDLGKDKTVSSLYIDFLHMPERKIRFPHDISISISSDGVNFMELTQITDAGNTEKRLEYKTYCLSLKGKKTRFIHLKAQAKEDKSILFVDEIVVE